MHMGDAPGIGTAADIKVGVTTITSGTSGRILYNNAGVLGEMTTTGSGTVVALATSPVLVTPTLGVAIGTSLALGGATITGFDLATANAAKIGTSAGTNQLEVGKNQNATTEVSVRNTDATNTVSRAFFRAYSATVTASLGAIAGNACYVGSDTNHPFNLTINGGTAATLSTDGAFTVGTTAKSLTGATALWAGAATLNSVTTNTPNGGTAGVWKLGIRVAATTTLDTTQYLQVDIGGTLYKVGVVTS